MLQTHPKLEYYARMTIPALCTLMLFLTGLVPISITGLSEFSPDVFLISIYYWSIFRPGAMPFWLVFLFGLLRDALFGFSLGVSSLLFIFFRMFVLSQQKHLAKESFWTTWVGFALVTVPILFAHWLLACAFSKALLPALPLLMQWVFTVGLYPLLYILFNSVYRFLPPAMGTGKSSLL